MTTCPVCYSTDIGERSARFDGPDVRVRVCHGCGRILSFQTIGREIFYLPSADEIVAVAEAIVRGRP